MQLTKRWIKEFSELMMRSPLLLVLSVSSLISTSTPMSTSNIDENSTKYPTTIGEPNYVNPYNYNFIMESGPCTAEDQLLIVIHTSTKPTYSHRRMLMRATWLNREMLSEKLGLKVKIVFFTGKANDSLDQRRIEYENEVYRDIVQSDFEDNYKHNTYKAMSYLLWTSQNCANASLLMKLDDDVLLKVHRLDKLTPSLKSWIASKAPVYIGKPIDSTPNRDPTSKWYVSVDIYPEDKYPTWFQGLVYFLSPQNAGQLFQTALNTRYMHTDDVYVGILVSKNEDIRKGTVKKGTISEFAMQGFDLVKTLRPAWLHGQAMFFHVPNTKVYLQWAFDDLYGYIPKYVPWFQW